MRRNRSDIPLQADAASRVLPWLVAVMAYLAVLALAGAFVVAGAVQEWSAGVRGTLTVQIPPAPEGDTMTDKHVEQARLILQDTAGVVRIRVLEREEIAQLIRPWLPGADASQIALPRLIDVGQSGDAAIDLARLRARLTAAVPGATIEDHQKWMSGLLRLGNSIMVLALAIPALTLAATVLTVVFAVHTGLNIHRDVTEILHLIGARDRYIARQFERNAMWMGFRGGLIGTVAALATILLIGQLAGRIEAFDLPVPEFSVWQWLCLALLPVAAALVARFSARATVLRSLAKMA
jgi:cell division transport system permease protein